MKSPKKALKRVKKKKRGLISLLDSVHTFAEANKMPPSPSLLLNWGIILSPVPLPAQKLKVPCEVREW